MNALCGLQWLFISSKKYKLIITIFSWPKFPVSHYYSRNHAALLQITLCELQHAQVSEVAEEE